MPLARVHNVVAFGSLCLKGTLDRLDGGTSQTEVVAHLIDIASWATKVCLHVDHEKGGILRTQVAIIKLRIRISFDVRHDRK